jgi:hypothetical protein
MDEFQSMRIPRAKLELCVAKVHNPPYQVISEYASLPIFALRSPQQELKDKLAALNVGELSAEQISQLLGALS